MKDTLIEVRNNLQGNYSKVDEAENQISDLEHKRVKNNQLEIQEEKRIKKTPKDSESSLGDNFKRSEWAILPSKRQRLLMSPLDHVQRGKEGKARAGRNKDMDGGN